MAARGCRRPATRRRSSTASDQQCHADAGSNAPQRSSRAPAPGRPDQQRQRGEAVQRLQRAQQPEQQAQRRTGARAARAWSSRTSAASATVTAVAGVSVCMPPSSAATSGRLREQRERRPAHRRRAAPDRADPPQARRGGDKPQRIERAAGLGARQHLGDRLQHVAGPRRQRPHLVGRVERIAAMQQQLPRQAEVIGEVVVLHGRQPRAGRCQAENHHGPCRGASARRPPLRAMPARRRSRPARSAAGARRSPRQQRRVDPPAMHRQWQQPAQRPGDQRPARRAARATARRVRSRTRPSAIARRHDHRHGQRRQRRRSRRSTPATTPRPAHRPRPSHANAAAATRSVRPGLPAAGSRRSARRAICDHSRCTIKPADAQRHAGPDQHLGGGVAMGGMRRLVRTRRHPSSDVVVTGSPLELMPESPDTEWSSHDRTAARRDPRRRRRQAHEVDACRRCCRRSPVNRCSRT